jgi:hypothetical protein
MRRSKLGITVHCNVTSSYDDTLRGTAVDRIVKWGNRVFRKTWREPKEEFCTYMPCL